MADHGHGTPGADGSAWSLRGSAQRITREPVGCGALDKAGKAAKAGMGTMCFLEQIGYEHVLKHRRSVKRVNYGWWFYGFLLFYGILLMIPWLFGDDSMVFWCFLGIIPMVCLDLAFLVTQGVAVRSQLCPWASPTVPSSALFFGAKKRCQKSDPCW